MIEEESGERGGGAISECRYQIAECRMEYREQGAASREQ
jgi:hypothetical protein